jgi:NAD(P)-dependent dehydrogenase (short-subunit alcohol dehydrogenase family)
MAKVSVVTGGAGGMGIDIARRLAKVGKVIVADFQEARIEGRKD